MEKQQLEELLDKYEIWNTHGHDVTLQIKEWKEGKEYDLVSTNWQRLFYPREGTHYHFGSTLYLIYKPKLIVDTVSDINYDDGPAPKGRSHTNLQLDEQKKQVIVTYTWDNLQRKASESKIKKFRWVTIKRQGRKPEFRIEEFYGED